MVATVVRYVHVQVEAGLECGLTLSGFTAFQEGDEIECHKVVWSAPTDVLAAGDSGVVQAGSGEGKSYGGGGGGQGNSR